MISRRKLTDAEYTNDLTLIANTPAQTEYLLHSQEQQAGGIYLYINVNKEGFMYFKLEGNISTQSGVCGCV